MPVGFGGSGCDVLIDAASYKCWILTGTGLWRVHTLNEVAARRLAGIQTTPLSFVFGAQLSLQIAIVVQLNSFHTKPGYVCDESINTLCVAKQTKLKIIRDALHCIVSLLHYANNATLWITYWRLMAMTVSSHVHIKMLNWQHQINVTITEGYLEFWNSFLARLVSPLLSHSETLPSSQTLITPETMS